MVASNLRTNYSPYIRITLCIGDKSWRVERTGPGYIVPRDNLEIGPCDAELVMSLDGQENRSPVHLPNGAVPFDHEVACVKRDSQ